MLLCFGSMTKTVLITQTCFSYCWAVLTQHQGHQFLALPQQWLGWGCTRSWEGTQVGQLAQLTKEIFHTIWCHVQQHKPEERRKKEGHSEWRRLSSQGTIMCDGALLSWRWLNTSLPVRSGDWIPCFALLVTFALPIKLSLSHEFSHFYPPVSL